MNRNDLKGRNTIINKEIKTDYNNYSFTAVEELQNIAIAVVVTAGAAYLFYEDIRGMIFCPVVWKFVRKLRRQKKQKERQRVLAKQFQDGMQSVCTALFAGFCQAFWRRRYFEFFGGIPVRKTPRCQFRADH